MEMHKVQSSNIAEIGHDGHNLRVVFKNGATYDYVGVPPEEFHNLLNADSIGGHLNTHIKGTYDHERVR